MLYQENQQEQLQYNSLPQQLWFKLDKDLINRLINAAYHTFDESSENNLKQFLDLAINLSISRSQVHNIIQDTEQQMQEHNEKLDKICTPHANIIDLDEVFPKKYGKDCIIFNINEHYSSYALQSHVNQDKSKNPSAADWKETFKDPINRQLTPDLALNDFSSAILKGTHDSFPQCFQIADSYHYLTKISETNTKIEKSISKMDDESENYDAFETFMIEQDIFESPNEDQLIELYEIYPTMPQAFVQELNEYEHHHGHTKHLKEINQEIKDIKGFFAADIINPYAMNHEDRVEMFDYCHQYLQQKNDKFPHPAITTLIKSLEKQKPYLLNFSTYMDNQFTKIVDAIDDPAVDNNLLWQFANLKKYTRDKKKKQKLIRQLIDKLGKTLYLKITQLVEPILELIANSTCTAENFNKIISRFLKNHKKITQSKMNAKRFIFNLSPMFNSKHQHIKGKKPAEVLTGKKFKRWTDIVCSQPTMLVNGKIISQKTLSKAA
jgi:hypothetical protein